MNRSPSGRSRETSERPDSAEDRFILLSQDFESLKSEVERLRAQLAMLVLERDELLFVECKNIETAYMLSIGALEYRAFEIECAVLRLKRKAEIIRAKKNRQEPVVLSAIEELLDIAFAQYQAKLNERIEKMNAAIERSRGAFLSDAEAKELKSLYRAVVKALHPDLHPDSSDAKIQLFQNAAAAYEKGDLDGLRIIAAMVAEPVPLSDGPDSTALLTSARERLLGLLQTVEERIVEIKSEYPYTMKPIVQSPERTEARKTELREHIGRLNETLAAYTAKIEEMLR